MFAMHVVVVGADSGTPTGTGAAGSAHGRGVQLDQAQLQLPQSGNIPPIQAQKQQQLQQLQQKLQAANAAKRAGYVQAHAGRVGPTSLPTMSPANQPAQILTLADVMAGSASSVCDMEDEASSEDAWLWNMMRHSSTCGTSSHHGQSCSGASCATTDAREGMPLEYLVMPGSGDCGQMGEGEVCSDNFRCR
uniref:Uncharacterized protein n=1 Tax=Chlamydomonas leiostraca TaxID=1034604 RepID=A0A7S0S373_9CHLO